MCLFPFNHICGLRSFGGFTDAQILLMKLFAPIQVAEMECPGPPTDPPEVPSHPAVTRRAQFRIKKKIKDEKAARKGKGKGRNPGNSKKKGKGKGSGSVKGKGKGKKGKTAKKKSASKNKRYTRMKRMNSKMQAATAKKKQEAAVPETETKKRKKTTTEESAASMEKKPRKRTRTQQASAAPGKVDPDLKNQLALVLKDCGGGANCTADCHDFTMPKVEGVLWSVYWKANGVGVVLDPAYLEGYQPPEKNSRKPKWKHSAHFGIGTCTECNLLCANKWVS